MRRIWRWVVYGKSREVPTIVIPGDIVFEDPRTDALKAMAAAMQAQTLALERGIAVLERAEERALGISAAGQPEGVKELEKA